MAAIGVTKRFGRLTSLDSVDLSVAPGEVVALLGANGAGKTTLVKILATTMVADEGRAVVDGWDVARCPSAARRATGLVLGEDRSFYWRLSARDNLEFFAALHGMRRGPARRRAAEVLDRVGLAPVADRRVDRYSTGMRARLGLARALLGSPPVLLMDEPTRSLDPVAAVGVRELVLSLATEHSTAVLFVTHDLHEAAAIASRVVILAAGRVAALVPGGADAAGLELAFAQVGGMEA